jgi:hypothetical protein
MIGTYKVIRQFQKPGKRSIVIKSGLTESEAREHCFDPETSSMTAKSELAASYTAKHGHWRDSMMKE